MSDKDRRQEAMRDRVKGPNSKSANSSETGEADTSGGSDESREMTQNDMMSKTAQPGKSSMMSKSDTTEKTSVKDRPSTLMYLLEAVDEDLRSEFKRLDYECDRDLGWTPKKNEHYYPMVVIDGVESITDISAEEFRDRLDELNLL